MAHAWLVRAGRDDEFERDALDNGVVGLGWRRVGDLNDNRSVASIRALVDTAYPEYSLRTRQGYAAQLFAFRSGMKVGDHVVLLRSNAPDVALGTITGDYAYRADLSAQHTRSVQWVSTEVSRSGLGSDLLIAPALTSIYRINGSEAANRVASVMARGDLAVAEMPVPATPTQATALAAIDKCRRNLEYAMSLASAGYNLQQLKVEAFEVSDVFRAAWVQAVASLDHWVHQEMHDRMVAVAGLPAAKRPKGFAKLVLPAPLAAQVSSGSLTLARAVDQNFDAAFGHKSYQNPWKIEQGLAYVVDVGDLWARVAQVLTERGDEGESYDAATVKGRLTEIVFRRNKIAHEWDEDPDNPPAKRPIDVASTTTAIKWVGQAVEAMLVVLDGA